MAWKAIITDFDLTTPTITYSYYDDSDPANTPEPQFFLYSLVFRRGDIGTNAELQAQVVARGQKLRPVYNRVQALKAQGVITIP
jgi:hypothetical protein